jgi:hypothetical protein
MSLDENLGESPDRQSNPANQHLDKALCIDDSKAAFRIGGHPLDRFQGSLAIHLLPCSLDKKECVDASEVSKLRVTFSLQNALPNFSSLMQPMVLASDFSDLIPLNSQFASEHFVALQRADVLGNGLFFSTFDRTDWYTRILSKRSSLALRSKQREPEPRAHSTRESYFAVYLAASNQLMQVKRRSMTITQCFRYIAIDLALIFSFMHILTTLYHHSMTKEVLVWHVFNIESTSDSLYKAGCEKIADSLNAINLLRDLSTMKFLLDRSLPAETKPTSLREVLKEKAELWSGRPPKPRAESEEAPSGSPRFAAFDSAQQTPFKPKRLGQILHSSQPLRKPVLRAPLPRAVNYSIDLPNSGRSSALRHIL